MFFKKNKTDEDFEDYQERGRKWIKRVPKDEEFRDLNPKNQKKRKEPKKPWGKKERLFVLIIIFLTAGVSLILSLDSYSWKISGLPSVPFSLFKEETFMIEGNKKEKEKSEKIISEFKKRTDGLSGMYGLYIINLENGYSFGVNKDETFQAASLIKLPVMISVLWEVESGNLEFGKTYRLKNSDKIGGSGSLYNKPEGFEITYKDLFVLMGKQSDNTAFNIFRKILGDSKIEETIRKIGMLNTSLKENKTTPRDIGILFQKVWEGDILSNSFKEDFFEALEDTIYESWLAAGIPKEVRIAHKYGREVHVVNDAGVVFSKNPYVVVILSKGVKEKEADEIFPILSRLIYEVEVSD